MRRPVSLYWLFGSIALLLAAACSGASSSDATSNGVESASGTPLAIGSPIAATPTTASPSPTASPVRPSTAQSGSTGTTAVAPSGQRIFNHILNLANAIGPRPAGTSQEMAAVNYIADQMRSFGYDVTIQEFPIPAEATRESSFSITSSQQRTIPSVPFEGSGAGSVRAELVLAGIGTPEEIPASVQGKIVLIERGTLLFRDKVANATAAGASGVVIYNNEQGTFLGSLGVTASVPVAAISQSEGQALAASLQSGSLKAELAVGGASIVASHNVIARPPGKECETVTGGHLDSVAVAPGASDNASGTAAVIEIAQIIAGRGEMASHCFVLFGAEEVGLYGSRAYVMSLTTAQRVGIKAMLNLDMVGVGNDTWALIGDRDLQQAAAEVAGGLGIDAQASGLPSSASSDHASFRDAGIPALMLHRLTDNLLHTPQDVSDRIRPELLEQAARLSVAFLEKLATIRG